MYGSALLKRIHKPAADTGGLDLGEAAVLTHIRTQATGEHDASLSPGEGEQVRGAGGEGRGAQHQADKVRLSTLIDLLNDRFGTELTEADQVWFDQQVEAAAADEDLRKVAEQNSEEQFGYVFDKQFEGVVIDRHEANDDLFRMFFDKPEFREALTAWARREAYKKIRDELGGAA